MEISKQCLSDIYTALSHMKGWAQCFKMYCPDEKTRWAAENHIEGAQYVIHQLEQILDSEH